MFCPSCLLKPSSSCWFFPLYIYSSYTFADSSLCFMNILFNYKLLGGIEGNTNDTYLLWWTPIKWICSYIENISSSCYKYYRLKMLEFMWSYFTALVLCSGFITCSIRDLHEKGTYNASNNAPLWKWGLATWD